MNVLWPVETPALAEDAIPYVAAQWPSSDTVVRLLAVVQPIAPPAITLWYDGGGSLERVLELREEAARELVRELAGRLSAQGFAVEEVVRRGSPRRLVAREAREWPADLVVLTVPKRPGLARRVFGGPAMRLAHYGGCAVEIVRAKRTGDEPARSVPTSAVLRWWMH